MIKLIAVGKIPNHFKEAQDYYLRKINRISPIEILELKKQRTKDEEGKKLLSKATGFKIILDESGKELTSKEFAKILSNNRKISFLIGGADGHSEQVKKSGDLILSLSKMTLQHDVARIVLLEQIYRGFQIIKGTPYHRA